MVTVGSGNYLVTPTENTRPVSPKLGDCWVEVYREKTGGWSVHVRLFKENTLRGDSYWVTEAFYTYAKEADARRFASRFRND